MTATRVRLVGALCVVALTAAGCGGGGASDSAKVTQTVTRALAALANGDGPGFCALATAGAQAELAKVIPGASCVRVVQTISRQLSYQVKLGLRHAQVGRVTIDGRRASIRAGDITSSQGTIRGFLKTSGPPTKLARQPNGSWKISG